MMRQVVSLPPLREWLHTECLGFSNGCWRWLHPQLGWTFRVEEVPEPGPNPRAYKATVEAIVSDRRGARRLFYASFPKHASGSLSTRRAYDSIVEWFNSLPVRSRARTEEETSAKAEEKRATEAVERAVPNGGFVARMIEGRMWLRYPESASRGAIDRASDAMDALGWRRVVTLYDHGSAEFVRRAQKPNGGAWRLKPPPYDPANPWLVTVGRLWPEERVDFRGFTQHCCLRAAEDHASYLWRQGRSHISVEEQRPAPRRGAGAGWRVAPPAKERHVCKHSYPMSQEEAEDYEREMRRLEARS